MSILVSPTYCRTMIIYSASTTFFRFVLLKTTSGGDQRPREAAGTGWTDPDLHLDSQVACPSPVQSVPRKCSSRPNPPSLPGPGIVLFPISPTYCQSFLTDCPVQALEVATFPQTCLLKEVHRVKFKGTAWHWMLPDMVVDFFLAAFFIFDFHFLVLVPLVFCFCCPKCSLHLWKLHLFGSAIAYWGLALCLASSWCLGNPY